MSAPPELPSRRDGHAPLIGLFVIYLVLLGWIVLWKLQVPYVGEGWLRQVKLVPFVPSAGSGASAPGEVLANVLLFVPFGLYLALHAPSWPWWKAAGTVAGASLLLEITQYVLAVGSSDATDLVANTAGGVAGFALLAVVRRRLGTRTDVVMVRVCAVGTVLAVLAVGTFVALPLRYASPRDVPIGSPPSMPRSTPR